MGNSKFIHPNGRKAQKLHTKKAHEDKLKKRKKETNVKSIVLAQKISWFKNNITDLSKCKDANELRKLIPQYLNRICSESSSEVDCPISVSVDAMRQFVELERKEYASAGLPVPDVTSKKGLAALASWNGSVINAKNIPMVIIRPS